ncbi:MAG: hypothetical protein SGI96_06460 [Bacteroidota bacterium]|nr:hypothetical protein [Bacteroidota bacterium]
MKKILYSFLIAITTIAIANATGTPVKKFNAAQPSASMQKMWVDYDATEDGRAGMLIHIALTVYDMKGRETLLGFYFKHDDGNPNSYIKEPGNTNKYHTASGILCVAKILVPNYDVSVYDDITVFIPYDEFKLDPGEYDLTIDVQMHNKNTDTGFAWFDMYDFTFSKGDNSRSVNKQAFIVKNKPASTTGPRAVFDTLWVDFDVKENNEMGMRIHFKFATYNMKDTLASVAIYFLYNTNEMKTLKDKNQKFVSGSGDVTVYMDINPGYDTAYFNDLVLFMPYDELDLTPGTYELLMDTKVIYSRGGLISNFVYQPFRYTEPAR